MDVTTRSKLAASCVETLEGRVFLSATGLTIELKQGPNLRSNPVAAAAFRKAADFLQSLFSFRVMAVVDVELATRVMSVIGQTTSVQFHYHRLEYNGIRDLIVRDASATERPLVGRLPTDSQLKLILPRTTGASSFI